ncbi:hypothetical protein GCM10017744_088460 [Streptomyces antimycoticus]|uniref:Uncharacterized protein n=1 Tax=Streptomyces antimycoticus TaxID=68175 RepID=A0A4D4JYV3_9ACTN|nr:hypothetical protein [Streptomyces antimycoticus]GDY39157.1 hypothetical protein SANT12839_000390 [Streptomyces antimycoticus]
MARTTFGKQVEEPAECLLFGIGRILTGWDLDGVKRTEPPFWCSGTWCRAEGALR